MSSSPSRRALLLALLALPVARALPAADPLAARFEAWSASRTFVVTEPQRG
jgi:hypothetical protein